MTDKLYITPQMVLAAASQFADDWLTGNSVIYGVPRGGVPCAIAAATVAGCRIANDMDTTVTHILDDIYDSGATFKRFKTAWPQIPFTVLFDKRDGRTQYRDRWLVMPWEAKGPNELDDTSAHDAVTRLLQYIGEDPTREGLIDTPARVIKAWGEWASGYKQDPKLLFKTFTERKADEMVIVHGIPIVSKCEHHLADIIGTAHIGYVPDKRIIGLSKIPRLVEVYARRLQVQERLTYEIADALVQGLQPRGVGVLIRASHGCMSTRGVRIHGSTTTTSAMRGVFLEKPEARAEFLALCRDAEGR